MTKLDEYNHSRVTRDYTLADAMRDELLAENAELRRERDEARGKVQRLLYIADWFDDAHPRDYRKCIDSCGGDDKEAADHCAAPSPAPTKSQVRHPVCGCPIGSKTCAYQNPSPDAKEAT